MSHATRITINFSQSGQTRRYGPTERRGTILVESTGWTNDDEFAPVEWGERVVKERVRSQIGWQSEKDGTDPKPEWHHTVLREFVKIAPGTWRFHTYQEYLD